MAGAREVVDAGPPMRFSEHMGSLRRIAVALAGLVAVTAVGTVGYVVLGFPPLDALYQTVTTVSTVGFREIQPMSRAGIVFTIVLIVVGVGTVLYNLGVILEALTEGHLRRSLERRRMDNRISHLRGHVIVCGHGRVGRSAADHLLADGQQVVVVDTDPERLVGLRPTAVHLVGDVTDDAVLRSAGIEHARALVAALETDADTVYVTLSARAMRPDLVIVARARTAEAKEKMLLAGATRAVNPQNIGGRRMAAFALQPDVAEFLDVVMLDEYLDFRIQQVRVEPGSALSGRTLAELDLHERTGSLILALRASPGSDLEAKPPAGTTIPDGAVLIALGTPAELESLSRLGRTHG